MVSNELCKYCLELEAGHTFMKDILRSSTDIWGREIFDVKKGDFIKIHKRLHRIKCMKENKGHMVMYMKFCNPN